MLNYVSYIGMQTENEFSECTKPERCTIKMHFLVFSRYNEMVVRELKDLSRFISSRHNLNMGCTDDTMLMADLERKLK